MVAILVLATFIIFVVVDYYFQRHRPQPVKAAETPAPLDAAWVPQSIVGGFNLPANLSYPPGHAWATKEGRQLVRAGSRLSGGFRRGGLERFRTRVLGL